MEIFTGSIPIENRIKLDNIRKLDYVDNLRNILDGVTLADFQTKHVAFTYFSNRALLGDDAGLGKTYETGAWLRCHKLAGTLKKVIVITEPSAIYQFIAKIYNITGMRLLPVFGAKVDIKKVLRNFDYTYFDGIITSHYALGNGKEFSRQLLQIKDSFNTLVYDEGSRIENTGSIRSYVATYMFRHFRNRLILNGVAFTTKLDQLCNQLNILDENLNISINKINKEFGVYSPKKDFFANTFKLLGYKDTDKFLDQFRYHYIGTTREEQGIKCNPVPELHLIEPTSQQLKVCNGTNYEQTLLQPSDIAIRNDTVLTEIPIYVKFFEVLFQRLKEGNVVIFVEHVGIKRFLKPLIERLVPSSKVTIIDGKLNKEENKSRETERKKFENKEYNVLLTNISTAIDLGSANAMMFLTIPYDWAQAVMRIDRGINDSSKRYDFFIYNQINHINMFISRYQQEKLMNNAINKKYRIFTEIIKDLETIVDIESL